MVYNGLKYNTEQSWAVASTGEDSFGPLKYIIHNIIVKLPRKVVSETHIVSTGNIMLNYLNIAQGIEYYKAIPIPVEKTLSKEDAALVVKQYIWNNFFGLCKKYSDRLHYPISLRYNLKNKLNIKNIDSLDGLQDFISCVVNAIFDKIIYMFDSKLLATANNICKGVVKMENVATYRIKKEYIYWLKD